MSEIKPAKIEIKKIDVLDTYFHRLLEDDLAKSYLVDEIDQFGTDLNSPETPFEEPPRRWNDFPFQAVICRFGKVEYAFPLHTIRSITKLTELRKPFSTTSPFTKGILQYKDRSICVVDLEAWLGTTRFVKREDVKPDRKNCCLILDHQWGIFLPTSPDLRTLFPSRINWREGQETRSWVLGTVVDTKCSILCGERLGTLFDSPPPALHTK